MTIENQQFEKDIEEMLGNALRNDKEVCVELWSALANVAWYHPETKSEASYSFRVAGYFICEIIGDDSEMGYMNWYCSGPYATVSRRIAKSLKKKGWIFDDLGEICDVSGCIEEMSCGTPTKNGYISTCLNHSPSDVK